MKCKVCNHEVEQGRAKCPMCGFPMLQMVGGNADEEKKMDELASNYRKKKLKPVKIALKVYTNAMSNGNCRVTREDYIPLADGEGLAAGDIIWYPEKFARQSGDCPLKLSLVNTGEQKKELDITVANPQIMDFWRIGIRPEEGFQFRVLIGNEKNYASSETVSYL